MRNWRTFWWGLRAVVGLGAAAAVGLTAGCQPSASGGLAALLPLPSANSPAETNPENQDIPAMLVTAPARELSSSPPARRVQIVLTVLHVQVPQASRGRAAPLWNHVREDVVDHATRERLRDNGVRVGIGNSQWWDAVKAVLDGIPDVRSHALDPVRLPEDYPLALELDRQPRDQTLFFVGDDGILTGETWPASRTVLRLSCSLRRDDPDRLRLALVPEVRQRLDGFRWVRNDAGLVQMPNYNGRAFPAAGCVIDLGPGEFLLMAPGERADVFGMLGGVLLVRADEEQRCDSLVFVRADIRQTTDKR